jgi:hypothetical protein
MIKMMMMVMMIITISILFQADIVKDMYAGDIPLVSTWHGSTESLYGTNLDYRNPNPEYTLMPWVNFYEFIPVEHIEEDVPETILAHQVITSI